MSNKFHIPYYEIANTIYVTIHNEDGNVWNTSSKTFGVWDDSGIANYVVNATYKGGSLYMVEFPLDISRGFYTIMIFLQGGVSPVVANDIWLGTLGSYWDKDNNNLVGVRVDSLVEYFTGQRFTEKALEQAPTGAGGDGVVIIERTPKVQVKAEEGVETVTVPAEIEVLDPAVKRESSAEITDEIQRTSNTKVGI